MAFPDYTHQHTEGATSVSARGPLCDVRVRALPPVRHTAACPTAFPHPLPSSLFGSYEWQKKCSLSYCQASLHSQFVFSSTICTHCLPTESPDLWFQSPLLPLQSSREEEFRAKMQVGASQLALSPPLWKPSHNLPPGRARSQSVRAAWLDVRAPSSPEVRHLSRQPLPLPLMPSLLGQPFCPIKQLH